MTIDEQIQEVIHVLERLDYGVALQNQTDTEYYLYWWDKRDSKYMSHGTFLGGYMYSFGVNGVRFNDFNLAITAFAEYMNWYRKFS